MHCNTTSKRAGSHGLSRSGHLQASNISAWFCQGHSQWSCVIPLFGKRVWISTGSTSKDDCRPLFFCHNPLDALIYINVIGSPVLYISLVIHAHNRARAMILKICKAFPLWGKKRRKKNAIYYITHWIIMWFDLWFFSNFHYKLKQTLRLRFDSY